METRLKSCCYWYPLLTGCNKPTLNSAFPPLESGKFRLMSLCQVLWHVVSSDAVGCWVQKGSLLQTWISSHAGVACGLPRRTLWKIKGAFFDKCLTVFLLVLILEHAVKGSKLQESKEIVDSEVHAEDTSTGTDFKTEWEEKCRLLLSCVSYFRKLW